MRKIKSDNSYNYIKKKYDNYNKCFKKKKKKNHVLFSLKKKMCLFLFYLSNRQTRKSIIIFRIANLTYDMHIYFVCLFVRDMHMCVCFNFNVN